MNNFNFKKLFTNLCFMVSLLHCKAMFALTFIVHDNENAVGEIKYVRAQAGETLEEIGLQHDIGYHEIVRVNPRLLPHAPLQANTRIMIPSRFVLPKISRPALVINLAEFRLYFFPAQDNVVLTYPVGIGRKGWNTPTGLTKIIAKERAPAWRPSSKLRAENAKNGVLLPETFPPGSANPLGMHVLRLGWPSYLIHGSNNPYAIGKRSTAGCIRLLAEDMEYLFSKVPVGTPVKIVNIPRHKAGFQHKPDAWG
ncbi:L,D-transpeptidase family protein [Legionella septentrionalis]|uniref:L,D-transpeptidase n=1 Tax=Legionella septentrionalis TaxID=2498109 RepID=A0A3S0V9Y9_9GAMM|nr:L,D-transpeptidase family protein [Legionella septentrionalis]RUQ82069.1 L,D-transpeptidase [Legionella septentrionalis]RUQ95552.1 L,D-transpeptidase [Legionella septentrionalis]